MRQLTPHRFRSHVEQVKQRLREKPLAFEASLSIELVQAALERCGVEFRERIYTPWVTLWAFIGQALSGDGSCRQAVCEVIAWLVSQGQRPCSPETSHYCQARQRLPLPFLQDLLSLQLQRASAEVPAEWKWLGKHDVKVVDGTTFSMPDTPENRAAFPPDGETQPGLRFPLLRAVVVFSLPLGLLRSFAFGPYQGKGSGESSLLRRLWDCFQLEDIVLGDKYYCSYRDVWELSRRGVHAVVKHFSYRTRLTRCRRLGKDDALYHWHRPKFARQKMSAEEFRELPESLLIRLVHVRVSIPGFRVQEFEILTTLLDEQTYSAENLAELFFLRWRGEMFLDDIKTTLGLDVLRCRTPEMVEKELLVGFLAHNTIRIHMAQAAECLQIPLSEISFKSAVCVMRTFQGQPPTSELIATKLATLVHCRVGHRPGRSEPRAVKRKAKPYVPLQTPRPTFANT